jgi:hypothetical protein
MVDLRLLHFCMRRTVTAIVSGAFRHVRAKSSRETHTATQMGARAATARVDSAGNSSSAIARETAEAQGSGVSHCTEQKRSLQSASRIATPSPMPASDNEAPTASGPPGTVTRLDLPSSSSSSGRSEWRSACPAVTAAACSSPRQSSSRWRWLDRGDDRHGGGRGGRDFECRVVGLGSVAAGLGRNWPARPQPREQIAFERRWLVGLGRCSSDLRR